MRFTIPTVFILITLACISCNSRSGSVKTDDRYFIVYKVVDGDTFWVKKGLNGNEKIRMIGVDAPESRNVFRKKKAFFGVESKGYLKTLLENEKVRFTYDVDRTDQYGRTLAYVYLEDGTFVNAELIKNGYAMVMTVPPNVKHAEDFLKLQQEARENSRGLWRPEVLKE